MMDLSNNDQQGAVMMDAAVNGGSHNPTTEELRNDPPVNDTQQQQRHLNIPDPPRAALIQHTAIDAKLYWDRSHYSSPAEQMAALEQSSTVYVGNLSFTIQSHHVHHHFTSLLSSSSSNGTSSFHIVKRVILGVDRYQHKPCGFCFVELYHRNDAVRAVSYISGTQLDGKVIRVELDAGFQNGRQFGRGKSGGQVRDDNKRLQAQRNENMKRYRSSTDPPTERPVRLDEALPSTRNHGSDTNVEVSNANTTTANEDVMDDDVQPRAKRMKLE